MSNMKTSEELPPVIFTQKDQNFLKEIYSEIECDLQVIDHISPKCFFTIYKKAFDQLIEHVRSYKPILTSIKAEYELLIESVERGREEARNLQDLITEYAHQPTTIENYRKHIEELNKRKRALQEECLHLEENVAQVAAATKAITTPVVMTETPAANQFAFEGRGRLPGLSEEESTDIDSLSKYKHQLDQLLSQLRYAVKVLFQPRTNQIILEKELRDLNEKKTQKEREFRQLQRLNYILQAAHKITVSANGRDDIGELMVQTLKGARRKTLPNWLVMSSQDPDADLDTEDDEIAEDNGDQSGLDAIALKEFQSGMAARRCTHMFTDFIHARQYKDAAILAACSPQGCLINLETFQRLREIEQMEGAELSDNCVMIFCDRLLAIQEMHCTPPTVEISFQCVLSALEKHRIELLCHWISSQRLTLSEAMGDLIHSYSLMQPTNSRQRVVLEMAATVYSLCSYSQTTQNTAIFRKSALCWVMTDRLQMALNDLHNYSTSASTFQTECQLLFEASFNSQLGIYLMEEENRSWLSIANLCVQNRRYDTLFEILQHLIDRMKENDPGISFSEIVEALQLKEIHSWEEWKNMLTESRLGHGFVYALDFLSEVLLKLCLVEEMPSTD